MMRKYFAFQQISLFVTSTCLVITYMDLAPLKERFANRLELFNESCLLCIAYHIFCFSDWVSDVTWRYRIGFSCVVWILVGLFGNMYVILLGSYTLIKKKMRIMKYTRAMKKQE